MSTFTTTAAITDYGVIRYIRLPNGSISGEYVFISNAQVESAQKSDNKNIMQELHTWDTCSNLTCACDVNSSLAAYAPLASTFDQQAVYIFHIYQGQLCYWLHYPFQPWTVCSDENRVSLPELPSSSDPLSGTQLAVTGDSEGQNITLIYQEVDGDLRCRYASNSEWNTSDYIQSAVPGTGIAAVCWDDNKSISVFYQDSDYNIKVCNYTDGQWQPGSVQTISSDPLNLTSIGATLWVNEQEQTEIRVYFQKGAQEIWSVSFTDGRGWYGSGRLFQAFNASFAFLAFCRGMVNDPVQTLWTITQNDRVLVQRVHTNDDKWLGVTGYTIPRSFTYFYT